MAGIIQKPVRDADGNTFSMTFYQDDNGNVYPLSGVGPEGTTDRRGLAADRPAPASVVPGSTYWSVDTSVVEVSDGTSWQAI